jgi:Ca-activated chloride channel homolog
MQRAIEWTRRTCLLAGALLALGQNPVPVFKADTNLQSIAVQVTDRRGNGVRGLTASDFTVLEDGQPQRIAFFGAEDQPVSLVILLDSSGSMESTRKLERARELLGPLIRGNHPEDEIFLVPFTDRVGPFVALTSEQRLNLSFVQASPARGGTALYDSLAAALCHSRTAKNIRQAVVVITDGADQHSRLRIEQLIHLTRSSRPQIFMIGFWGKGESDYYRQAGRTVTLVSGHEIDNPLQVFDRIAKESGAESFFPSSERDLKEVLERILGILRAQYTLAYYPEDIGKFRRIQVNAHRSGVTVAARHSAGSEAGQESVHFDTTSCEVSPVEHPYPWEPLVTRLPSGAIAYQESFADPRTGWPNRADSRYASGAYEMYRRLLPTSADRQQLNWVDVGTIAANGPWWGDFRASILVDDREADQEGEGMVFRLNDRGYYAVLLTRISTKYCSFKLLKKAWPDSFYVLPFSRLEHVIVPWTGCTPTNEHGEAEPYRAHTGSLTRQTTQKKITVECKGEQITIWLDDVQKVRIKDDSFSDGYVGMAQFGYGRALFRDLQVQSLQE